MLLIVLAAGDAAACSVLYWTDAFSRHLVHKQLYELPMSSVKLASTASPSACVSAACELRTCALMHMHGACRYQNSQPLINCPSTYAQGATGVYCPSTSIQLNGSSIPLFNSTTYYDKLVWAAVWMYRVSTLSCNTHPHLYRLLCMSTRADACSVPAGVLLLEAGLVLVNCCFGHMHP